MKQLFTLICFLISLCGFSQTNNVSISPLTEILMKKYYSASEIQELAKYPEKVKFIDYLYSKSFEVQEHQKYTTEQFNKIDVNKYNSARKLDSNALVFDEESGLSIVLYSLNKIEENKKMIMTSLKDSDPTNKIAN